MSKLTQTIENAVQPAINSLGYEIVDIEIGKEAGGKVLFIYIFHPEHGISLSDCEAVSKAIDPIIDELDPIEESYVLCVSSSGLERPLTRPVDFKRNMGERIEIGFYQPFLGKKKLVATLTGYDEQANAFTIDHEGESITLEIAKTARIRPFIEF